MIINADGCTSKLYTVPTDWKRRYVELGLTEDREQDYYNLLAETEFDDNDTEALKKVLQPRHSALWTQPIFFRVYPQLQKEYQSAETRKHFRKRF